MRRTPSPPFPLSISLSLFVPPPTHTSPSHLAHREARPQPPPSAIPMGAEAVTHTSHLPGIGRTDETVLRLRAPDNSLGMEFQDTTVTRVIAGQAGEKLAGAVPFRVLKIGGHAVSGSAQLREVVVALKASGATELPLVYERCQKLVEVRLRSADEKLGLKFQREGANVLITGSSGPCEVSHSSLFLYVIFLCGPLFNLLQQPLSLTGSKPPHRVPPAECQPQPRHHVRVRACLDGGGPQRRRPLPHARSGGAACAHHRRGVARRKRPLFPAPARHTRTAPAAAAAAAGRNRRHRAASQLRCAAAACRTAACAGNAAVRAEPQRGTQALL